MEQDDDDFLYGDPTSGKADISASKVSEFETDMRDHPTAAADEELEEGEEEEEDEELNQQGEDTEDDSDSDIEFVIEPKDGARAQPPPQSGRYNSIRLAQSTPLKKEGESGPTQSAATSQTPATPTKPVHYALDVSAVPELNGQPLTAVNLDTIPGDKPWRLPGADVTDYFNYGFDEFTWTAYTQKQKDIRNEFDPAKMMEQMMMMGGGMEAMMEQMMGAGGPVPGSMPPVMPPMPDMATMSAMMAGIPGGFVGNPGVGGMGGLPPNQPGSGFMGGPQSQNGQRMPPLGPGGMGGSGPGQQMPYGGHGGPYNDQGMGRGGFHGRGNMGPRRGGW